MKKFKKYSLGLIIVSILGYVTYQILMTETVKRKFKDVESNYLGGLERNCTLYSYTGQKIKNYNGRYDIDFTSAGRIVSEFNGKRQLVVGGIFECAEN